MQENNQDSINNQDRVSLIKFNKRLRRTFSLVQKDSNFAQLKNQVEKLQFDQESGSDNGVGYLPKALYQLVNEFQNHTTTGGNNPKTNNSLLLADEQLL